MKAALWAVLAAAFVLPASAEMINSLTVSILQANVGVSAARAALAGGGLLAMTIAVKRRRAAPRTARRRAAMLYVLRAADR